MVDTAENVMTTAPQVGHFIKIDVPGIGNFSGEGYDWVKVIEVQQSTEKEAPFYGFTVQPVPHPTADAEATAHFYQREATNTLIVRRLGNCVLAEAHGRNEVHNTDAVPLVDKIRNQLVAVGGKLGMGKVQWEVLVEALIQK